MNLQFYKLLQLIEIAYPNRRFDSSEIVIMMLAAVPAVSGTELFDIKKAHAHLDRLYRMGFLLRRRTKRQVSTRNAKTCNRGFKYEYSISKQGHNYLQYRRNPQSRKKRVSNKFTDLVIKIYAGKKFPDELKPYTEEICRIMFPEMDWEPIDNRFPVRPGRDLLMTLFQMIKDRDESIKIAGLRKELDEIKKSKTLEGASSP